MCLTADMAGTQKHFFSESGSFLNLRIYNIQRKHRLNVQFSIFLRLLEQGVGAHAYNPSQNSGDRGRRIAMCLRTAQAS